MFLRLLFATFLLFVNLYACKGGYSSCVKKVQDSHTFVNDTLALPITQTTRLVYAIRAPKAKILKYDPFLSLYLVKETSPFKYPFDINMKLELQSAVVTQNGSCEGRFTRKQIGLNSFAKYSQKVTPPSIITNSCCSIEGIVTALGIIQKEYILHFMKSKSTFYGDIGIRVDEKSNSVIVRASDPFMKNNPFQRGDRVLEFDGKRVVNAASLMQKILFSDLDTIHSVKIQRGSDITIFHVATKKRFGGGFVSDTFLESRGLYFDSKLRLTKITGSFKNYGLVLGDRLIQVNGVKVKTQEELRSYMENFTDYSSLLFERNHFEFFVNIK